MSESIKWRKQDAIENKKDDDSNDNSQSDSQSSSGDDPFKIGKPKKSNKHQRKKRKIIQKQNGF